MNSPARKAQPVLRLPRTTLDNYLDAVSVLGLMLMSYLLARYWPGLPQIIPTHFGASGLPDGWGSKMQLFVNMAICLLLYLGMTILYRYPHIYNYFFTIDDANAVAQYRLARSLVNWLKASVILMFAYTEWATIQTALGQNSGLGNGFVLVVLIFSLGPIMVYLYKSYQAR